MVQTNTYPRRSLMARCAEVIRFYGPFGFTAFGGPAANVVMLRKIFVVREKWVDDKTFTDLFALGNALPGPAFSQLAFAVALLRGGYIPALLSLLLLIGPGALAMLGFGFGVRHLPNTLPDIVFALFTGLNAAAVGLIALAAYNLSARVITDPITRIAVLLSAAIATCSNSQWLYPVLMVAGGLSTVAWDSAMRWRHKRSKSRAHQKSDVDHKEQPTPSQSSSAQSEVEKQEQPRNSDLKLPIRHATQGSMDEEAITVISPAMPPIDITHVNGNEPSEVCTSQKKDDSEALSPYFTLGVRGGLLIMASFLVFFVVMIILHATALQQRSFKFFVNLLIAGTIIFVRGGPVVIPLLRTYTVEPGWISSRDFILGFAVLQALPGPIFNFAVYLGVLALPNQPGLGAILGFVAIFLPGIILKMGLLPLYTKFKSYKLTQSIMRGVNAAAVGLIFAATYRLLSVGFISASQDPDVPAVSGSLDRDGWWVVITASTFVACEWFSVPAPVAIAGGAIGGIAWWGVNK